MFQTGCAPLLLHSRPQNKVSTQCVKASSEVIQPLDTLYPEHTIPSHTHTHAHIHSLTSHMQAHTCAWARVQLSPVFRAFMLFLQDLNKIPYVSGDELTSFRGGRKKRRQQRQKCSAGNCKCGCKISQYKHESDGDRVVSDHHSGVKCMQMYVCVVVCYVA